MIIRLLPNNDGTNLYFKQWGTLKVARVAAGGERTEYTLSPQMDAAARSAVFVGSLPPGNYRFASVPGYVCGYVCQPSALTPTARFSGFQIQPGKLTDLGTLVQGQISGSGGSVLMSIEPDPKGTATPELIGEFAPSLQPLLAQPRVGWDLTADTRALALLSEISLRLSRGMTPPQETAEPGRFIHGSASGTVWFTNAGGGRRPHALGERAGVETVLVTRDGHWYAGGEYSLLKVSSDKGVTWRNVRGRLPLGLVVGLLEHRGRVFVAMLRAGRLSVHSAPTGSDEWAPAFTAALNVNRFWDAVNVRPQLFADGDRVVASVPGQQLAVFDPGSGQLVTRELPGSIQYFSVGLDGLYRCRCGSVKVDPYESADQGRTWRQPDVSRYFMLPAWRDSRFAVRLQSSFAGPSKMAVTRDGGATWTEGKDPVPHDLAWFTFSRDGLTIFGTTLQGQFWESTDEGATWKSVKPQPLPRPPGAPPPPAPAGSRSSLGVGT